MDALRTGVLVLFVLLVPVSCEESFLSVPVTCYILDGVLIIYCIIATAFFFKEKFSNLLPVAIAVSEDEGGIYQELERPKDADPYQELDPSKRKKKAGKKKKPPPTPAQETDRDPGASAPPLSPR